MKIEIISEKKEDVETSSLGLGHVHEIIETSSLGLGHVHDLE